jgi:predicted nucleic acid-binding protein
VGAWRDGRFVLVGHELQFGELRSVTRRDHLRSRIRPAQAGKLINQNRTKAEIVERLPPIRRSEDPLDDFLLALCEASQADYLLTGNKTGLLALGTHGSTSILPARAFLDRLGRSGSSAWRRRYGPGHRWPRLAGTSPPGAKNRPWLQSHGKSGLLKTFS